jgi:HEAT repeat protein
VHEFALLEQLQGSHPKDRTDAACALGDRLRTHEIEFDPQIRLALLKALEDPVPAVRVETAIALSEVQEYLATPILLWAAKRPATRLDALLALGAMRDPSTVPFLQQLLRRWLLPWADRLQAAAALCSMQMAEGTTYLEQKLLSRRVAERAAAIYFIGHCQHPNACVLLKPILLNVKDPLRDGAARALGFVKDPQAKHLLGSALVDAEGELKEDILLALK